MKTLAPLQIVVLLVALAGATVALSQHSTSGATKLAQLEHEFGFRLSLPPDWEEHPWGVPPRSGRFGYNWYPSRLLQLAGRKLQETSTPNITVDVLTVGPEYDQQYYFDNYHRTRKLLLVGSGAVPLGIESGKPLPQIHPQVSPVPVMFYKKAYLSPSAGVLVGSQFQTAYLQGDTLLFFECIAITKRYSALVRLAGSPADFHALRKLAGGVCDSIRIRDGASWISPSGGVAVVY